MHHCIVNINILTFLINLVVKVIRFWHWGNDASLLVFHS